MSCYLNVFFFLCIVKFSIPQYQKCKTLADCDYSGCVTSESFLFWGCNYVKFQYAKADRYLNNFGNSGFPRETCVHEIYDYTRYASSIFQCPLRKCPAGYYNFINCLQCPTGKYQPISDNTGENSTCLSCPTGQVSPLGSTSSSQCQCPKQCEEGTYIPTPCNETTECQSCKVGSYCPSQSTSEKPCEAGYYCPNTTVQLPCPLGHFCPMGSGSPYSCPVGTFANVTGLSSCFDCPLNTYNVQNGSSDCIQCESTAHLRGKYRNHCGGSFQGIIVNCTNSI